MDDSIIAAVRAHAARQAPRECCGLVVRVGVCERYVPCRNVATDASEFAIHGEDEAAAHDAGEVVAVCHSHPFTSPEPSPADRTMCARGDVPWLIVNHPNGNYVVLSPEAAKLMPRLPLLGRTFVYGVHDCYSLMRDYYAEKLSIDLPDFPRYADWFTKGGNAYRHHFSAIGFVRVDKVQTHDVLLMQIMSPEEPNHVAVYSGNNQIIDHLENRLSRHSIYGGWYRKCTTHILRHSSLA